MTDVLVVSALSMALHTRKPESVFLHSDQGSQYTSMSYGQSKIGVRPSIGTTGFAYDDAMAEIYSLRWNAS